VQNYLWWRDHPEAWPLTEVQIGNRIYTADEAEQVMGENINGNGLVQLAQQEIAAKLNIANGAGHDCIDDTIPQVDVFIGDLVVPPIGNGFITIGNVEAFYIPLVRYNKGELCCARHCTSEEPDK
jgi:hypothetical protein